MTTVLARQTRRAFFFVLFTPLILGIVVALELSAYQQSAAWVAHTNLVLSTMQDVLLAITRAESAQRGFLLTRDPSYINWYTRSRGDVTRQIATVGQLTSDNPAQQHNTEQLKKLVQKRFQMMDLLLERRRRENFPVGEAGELLSDGTSVTQQIWDLTRRVNEGENALLRERKKTERETEVGVGASFVICILVNLGVLLWAYRIITQYALARELAAEQILRLNAELERRVSERTLELELANSNLKRSNDDLTKFAYIASHDLQEPLRTIGSYVGLLSLRYQGKLDDQADKYIKFVVGGAKRMQNLVQDLLMYSRAGTESLKLGTVNMDSVLRNVRDNLDLLISEQQASIESSPLPSLIGDESKLTQVLMNLLANAIKFRKPEVAPRIVIEASMSDSEWRFSVTDNGIGFDPQYAERIFTIFQRLHGVGTYAGTGMGLSICRRVIEQHGGRIWASSHPGDGATFWFTLPLQGVPNQPAIEERHPEDGRMGTKAVSR